MGDGEEVLCGACCEPLDRTCVWHACDSCADALHDPDNCSDVWHPHDKLHFCNKKCASTLLKSQRVVFVLQQRMPPAPSASPAAAAEAAASLPASRHAMPDLEAMLLNKQGEAARNVATAAAAADTVDAMLAATAPELAAVKINPILGALLGGLSAPSAAPASAHAAAAPAVAATAAPAKPPPPATKRPPAGQIKMSDDDDDDETEPLLPSVQPVQPPAAPSAPPSSRLRFADIHRPPPSHAGAPSRDPSADPPVVLASVDDASRPVARQTVAVPLAAAASTSATTASTAPPSRPLVVEPRDTPRTVLLPPPPDDGSQWRYMPTKINSDKAHAGPKGAMLALKLEPSKTSVLMCTVHVERDVTQQKHKLFKDELNVGRMNADIERLKNHSVTKALAKVGKQLLEKKYVALGEDAAAEYFGRVWAPCNITYAEANERPAGEEMLVQGGVPTQSNGLERQNGQQKVQLAFKREDLTQHLQSAFDDLEQESMRDLSFGATMPRGYTAKKRSRDDTTPAVSIVKEVWTTKFFGQVQEEMQSPIGVHLLTFGAAWAGPPGTLVMCGRAQRIELIDGLQVLDSVTKGDYLKTLRAAIQTPTAIQAPRNPNSYSFFNKFKLLIKDPAKAIELFKYNFEDIILWQKSFHILKPIRDEVFLMRLVERLQASKAKVDVDLLKDASKPAAVFYQCSCENYQHYLWCIHSCCCAMKTGLLIGFPARLDPTKITSVKTNAAMQLTHRPAKAVKGGALGRK